VAIGLNSRRRRHRTRA